eukprot:2511019-Rhodomonas_salina.1
MGEEVHGTDEERKGGKALTYEEGLLLTLVSWTLELSHAVPGSSSTANIRTGQRRADLCDGCADATDTEDAMLADPPPPPDADADAGAGADADADADVAKR